MTVTITKALANFFNTGTGKRPAKDFLAELKALSPAEKLELAEGICAITDDTLT